MVPIVPAVFSPRFSSPVTPNGTEGYAKAVREICSRYGVLMIADEVMSGTGRCGTWRALAHG